MLEYSSLPKPESGFTLPEQPSIGEDSGKVIGKAIASALVRELPSKAS